MRSGRIADEPQCGILGFLLCQPLLCTALRDTVAQHDVSCCALLMPAGT